MPRREAALGLLAKLARQWGTYYWDGYEVVYDRQQRRHVGREFTYSRCRACGRIAKAQCGKVLLPIEHTKTCELAYAFRLLYGSVIAPAPLSKRSARLLKEGLRAALAGRVSLVPRRFVRGADRKNTERASARDSNKGKESRARRTSGFGVWVGGGQD